MARGLKPPSRPPGKRAPLFAALVRALGLTGIGTVGQLPKWTSSSSLGDSGASMDGNNRLAVPVGIAFPGGSTLDAAPVAISGSGVAGRIAFWTSASAESSDANLVWDNTNKRLGVGTASPQSPFHVSISDNGAGAPGTDTMVVENVQGNNFTWATILFKAKNVGSGNMLPIGRIGAEITAQATNVMTGALGFWVPNAQNGVVQRMTLFGRGALVIGSTSDDGTHLFQVNGTATVSGGIATPSISDTTGNVRADFSNISPNTFTGRQANGASAVGNILDTNASYTTAGAKLASVRNAGTEKFGIDKDGKTLQPFTDTSGTPGAATANTPTGRSAIAVGASSVVITNSLCAAASQVRVTPRQFDTTLTSFIAVCAAGSFTVTGNANATAAWAFDWQVLN